MKKFCTGERCDGHFASLASFPGWHGLFGHLNVVTPDQKSIVTGRGKHDRVVAFCPGFDEDVGALALYCRVDHLWGLGMPSEKEILKVARKENGEDAKGRWKLASSVPWDDGTSTDIYFVWPETAINI